MQINNGLIFIWGLEYGGMGPMRLFFKEIPFGITGSCLKNIGNRHVLGPRGSINFPPKLQQGAKGVASWIYSLKSQNCSHLLSFMDAHSRFQMLNVIYSGILNSKIVLNLYDSHQLEKRAQSSEIFYSIHSVMLELDFRDCESYHWH